MDDRVLITGGAGFIGSHLAEELLASGCTVRALDPLVEQVHGPVNGGPPEPPEYLHPEVELRRGRVEDPEALRSALEGVTAVVHLAARVGVGQSMYELVPYTETNVLGTARLLEALVDRPVRKLVVASSMSVYGEGLYRDADGRPVERVRRTRADLGDGRWEPRGPGGRRLEPAATPEEKRPDLSSVYALSKYDQERLCLMIGEAYGIPTVALRLFNVFGPRQALSNPYTGVMAIFASRVLNGKPPLVYEDGGQRRDFVHVDDVVRAFRLALERDGADGRVLNVGSGESRTILGLARDVASVLGRPDLEPELTGKYRMGDVRHCFADVSAAREALGYASRVGFRDGLRDLARWLEGRRAEDHTARANEELTRRGLVV